METRIRWSAAEREALISALAAKIWSAPGRFKPTELLIAAQNEALPPNRHRLVTSVVPFQALLDEAQYRIKSTTEIPQGTANLDIPALIDLITERVLQRLAARGIVSTKELAQEVTLEVDPTLSRQNLKERTNINNGADAGQGPRPVGVLVVGCLPSQTTMIRQGLSDLLDGHKISLSFMTSAEAKTQKVYPRDHNFLMYNFLSHAAIDKFRSVPRDRCHQVTGISAILKSVRELVEL